MRVAYADPPYPGMAGLYIHHPDYAGEVDHAELIKRMEGGYDAWVLHTGSVQLKQVLALCPDDVRLLAWTKGWASFKPGASIKYSWEPVILRNPRERGKGQPFDRDWFMHNVVTNASTGADQGFNGSKPRAVCEWVFRCMCLRPEDELDDLFPGTGAVSAAWESWRSQLSLELPA